MKQQRRNIAHAEFRFASCSITEAGRSHSFPVNNINKHADYIHVDTRRIFRNDEALPLAVRAIRLVFASGWRRKTRPYVPHTRVSDVSNLALCDSFSSYPARNILNSTTRASTSSFKPRRSFSRDYRAGNSDFTSARAVHRLTSRRR